MDLEGRTAGIMPGLGLSVPGRKRTGSERSQGILSRPTTMTSPVFRPSRRVAPNETLSPFAKNTKIVETNSTNRLESIKPRKNELKTNPKRTAKQAEISTLTTRNRLNEANPLHISLPQPVPRSLEPSFQFEKDVKIVETNPRSHLESTKAVKNGPKTSPKRSEKPCCEDAIHAKQSRGPS